MDKVDNLLFCQTPDDLLEAAAVILKANPGSRMFALSGPMGVGKTTFIKAFCQQLGVEDMVSSPSFALVNEYHGKDEIVIYHFDFYRIKNLQEVMDLGYEEYFFSDSFCFLEWPESVWELLPPHFVYISLKETYEGIREISWHMHT